MRTIFLCAAAFLLPSSTAFTQNPPAKDEPAALSEYYLAEDVGADNASHITRFKRKPAPNFRELKNMIQQKRNQAFYSLLTLNEKDLAGRQCLLSVLELNDEQRREYQRCVDVRRERFDELGTEAERKINATKTQAEQEAIRQEFGETLAKLAKDLVKDFKPYLVPHQVDQLDQLLSSIEFQSATDLYEIYEVSLYDVCSAYLEFSNEEEKAFNEKTQTAITEFVQRVADAKRELRDDLLKAVPESKRDTYKTMVGEDPTWFVRQLKMSMMAK